MAINIKNNFAPIIEAKDNTTINIGSDDAKKRYEAVKKIVGDNIEDVDFEELSADKIEELKNACATAPVKDKPNKPRKKKEAPKLVSSVFTYCWLEDYPSGIVKLYQALLKGKFIDANTKPKDFADIFSGKDCDVKVKWIGKKAHLWYLFDLIFSRKYVTWPKGVGQWIIVQSHIIDKSSKVFLDFNSQHEPKKVQNAISQIADILVPIERED